MRLRWIDDQSDSRTDRYHMYDYLAQPWYIKPTLWARWGPSACVTRLFGFKLPGDDGGIYSPEGYTFSELGPKALSGKGTKEMDETRTRLIRERHGGCPFGT